MYVHDAERLSIAMAHAEQIDHINIVNWFKHTYPELEDDLHHFANERKCSYFEGKLLKRMGVKAGVYDLLLAIPLNGKAGLWMELKVGKGQPTKEQLEFGKRKRERGYEAIVVWGFSAAREAIIAYLKDYSPTTN